MECFEIKFKSSDVDSSVFVLADDEPEALTKFFNRLPDIVTSCIFPLTIYCFVKLKTF